ncbi:hypothetical protein AGMMS49965_25900 [Bacteroidia bacterium]|nr:hypothetical protein AGMMS49965_25900 [Bacteroidia bacterium]
MLNSLKHSLLLVMCAGFSSCNEADIWGFFASSSEGVEARAAQSLSWNEANGYDTIRIRQAQYRVYIAGDSHIGTSHNAGQLFSDAIADSLCAATIIVGDITNTGHAPDFVATVGLFRTQPKPTKAVIGNHDLYFDGWESFKQHFHTSVYYFIVETPAGSDLHICLDSSSGTLGATQTRWLEHTLTALRNDHRFCFVYSHINMFRTDWSQSPSGNMPLEETYHLMSLFSKNAVNMVFMGHDHASAKNSFNNVQYITLDAISDKWGSPSYGLLSCGEAFAFQFIYL